VLLNIPSGSLLGGEDRSDKPKEWNEDANDSENNVSLLKRHKTHREQTEKVHGEEQNAEEPGEEVHV
jgi:hypothetical protein